jgi:uncharacterized membrane protein YhhN
MADSPDPYFKLPLGQKLGPILGALCFGVLMYAALALGARDNLAFGVCFVVIGIVAAVAARRLTKSYSPSALGFYIFAASCVLFGGALIGARA